MHYVPHVGLREIHAVRSKSPRCHRLSTYARRRNMGHRLVMHDTKEIALHSSFSTQGDVWSSEILASFHYCRYNAP